MEARDTVMSEDELYSLPSFERDDILLAQAEVSFKAGIKEGRDGCAYCDTPLLYEGEIQEARSAGIREVVEWGLETCPHDLFGEGTQCYKRACDMCWSAKLKEWGLDTH